MPQGPPDLKYGELNNVRTPEVRTNPVQDHGTQGTGNIFRKAVIAADNSAKTDSTAGLGPLVAVVLKVIQSGDKPATNPHAAKEEWMLKEKLGITDTKSIVRFYGMIPELYTYPVPRSFEDHRRIERFPIFTTGDETLPVPSPGDYVVVGFESLENLSGGRYFGMAAPGVGQKKIDSKPKACPPPKVKGKGPKGKIGGIQHQAAHTGIKKPRSRLRISPRKCVAFGGNAIAGPIGSKIFGYMFSKGWTFISDLGTSSDVYLHDVPLKDQTKFIATGDGPGGERFLIAPKNPLMATPLPAWTRLRWADTGNEGETNMTGFENTPVALSLNDGIGNERADQAPLLSTVKYALRFRPDLVVFSFDGFGKYVERLQGDPVTAMAVPGLMKKTTAQFVNAVRAFAGDCIIIIIAPYRNITNDGTSPTQHTDYCKYGPKGIFQSSFNTPYMSAIAEYAASDSKLLIVDPYDHSEIHDDSASINKAGDEAVAIALIERLNNASVGGLSLKEQVRTSEAYIKPKRPKRKRRRRKVDRAASNGMLSQLKDACRMLGTYNLMTKGDYKKMFNFVSNNLDRTLKLGAPKAEGSNDVKKMAALYGDGFTMLGEGMTFAERMAGFLENQQSDTAAVGVELSGDNLKKLADKAFGKGAYDFFIRHKKDIYSEVTGYGSLKPHWTSIVTRTFDESGITKDGALIEDRSDLRAYFAKAGAPGATIGEKLDTAGSPANQNPPVVKFTSEEQSLAAKALKAITVGDTKLQPYGALSDAEVESFLKGLMKADPNQKTAKDGVEKLNALKSRAFKTAKGWAPHADELRKMTMVNRYNMSQRDFLKWGARSAKGIAKNNPYAFKVLDCRHIKDGYAGAQWMNDMYGAFVYIFAADPEGSQMLNFAAFTLQRMYSTLGKSGTTAAYDDYGGHNISFNNSDTHGGEKGWSRYDKSRRAAAIARRQKFSTAVKGILKGDGNLAANYNPHAVLKQNIQSPESAEYMAQFHQFYSIDMVPGAGAQVLEYIKKAWLWVATAHAQEGFYGITHKIDFEWEKKVPSGLTPGAGGANTGKRYNARGLTADTLKHWYQEPYRTWYKQWANDWPNGSWNQLRDFAAYRFEGVSTEKEAISVYAAVFMDHAVCMVNDFLQAAQQYCANEIGIKFQQNFGVAGTMSYTAIHEARGKTLNEKRTAIQDQLKKLVAAYNGERQREDYDNKPTNTGVADPCFDQATGLDAENGKNEPMTKGEPIPPGEMVKCSSIGIKRASFSFSNIGKRYRNGKAVPPWNIIIHESAGHGKGWKKTKAGQDTHDGLASYLNARGYGVHFIVSQAGGIYQYNHINDRLVHAGRANTSAIGIEIPSIYKALKEGKPWVKKDGSSKKYQWRYVQQGFVTRKIMEAITSGKAKHEGKNVTCHVVTGASATGGIGKKNGFVFWPEKQCMALYNLVNCLSAPSGPVGRNMHGGGAKMDWGIGNADISVAGIYAHCRVTGTSHVDGRFGECYIKFRLKIFKEKPIDAWYATIGNMLAGGGTLNASQAAIGRDYMNNFIQIVGACYGVDPVGVMLDTAQAWAESVHSMVPLAESAAAFLTIDRKVGKQPPKEAAPNKPTPENKGKKKKKKGKPDW